MKVLLENLLRHEDGRTVTKDDIVALAAWIDDKGKAGKEIGFRPARVLMQDFTGVPAVVDLAAMRDGMKSLGGDPQKINPLVPVDLVIDHSVIVDEFGSASSLQRNVELEYQRNGERYIFLKWGQGAFDNFRVVPPGTGICHQVNLEFLAQTVWTKHLPDGTMLAYPGHPRRHRQPHHHGQRPRRARLGRRRHRGGGRHARPAAVDADPRGDRLPADRQAQGRRDRDRPGAHRDADAAQEERGRQVRRVLRHRPRGDAARRPRHHRQHGAGVRRDLRLLPRRRRDAGLPHHLRPRGAPHRARRGLRQGAGPVPPQRRARSGLHRHARARPRHGGAVARRPQAARGPHRAARRRAPASPRRWRPSTRSRASSRSGRPSRAATSTSATATSSSPPSPAAPIPPTPAC